MEYVNPFGAMGDVSSIESPFLRDMERTSRKNLAMPFVDMARQEQELTLRKNDMAQQEWASPLAVQQRQAKLNEQLVDSQQNARGAPVLMDERMSNAQKTVFTNPSITRKQIAEADQAEMKARGTPAMALFDKVGTAWDHIKTLPEAARPAAAAMIAQQWEAEHPGAQLPSMMKEFDPIKWELSSYITNKAKRDRMEEQAAKDTASQKRTETVVQGRLDQADITGSYNVDRAGVAAGARAAPRPESLDQQRARANRIKEDPSSTNEEVNQAIAILRRTPENLKGAQAAIAARQLDIVGGKPNPATGKPWVWQDAAEEYYRSQGLVPNLTPTRPTVDIEQLKASLKQVNIPYEPEKYHYGINPKTGRMARTPK